jgi:creatinine amidohydrolase/Fe(II)-dependent formamide hydrolase-like protein
MERENVAARPVAARDRDNGEDRVTRRRKHGDPLRVLDAIDVLEVGPPRVDPNRVVAEYRVSGPRGAASTELIYRFEEDVLDPRDPASRNLASLMAVQVAMNYGLFCRRIVLHGTWDSHDERFVEEMTRHTAREIYVKKVLEPNPFLLSRACGLPARKMEFLRAGIELEGERYVRRDARGAWRAASDPRLHCVLSSGGKDSLLSHGLLTEMGRRTHPVFVNESGRHWYTAINAHRHFAAEVPNTARVWTTSDRVFTWMLRQLPFIRSDFDRLRSDEYPVRLWTVAVFIFAVLPLVFTRGIGRLVIGNEHDTTERQSTRGITHYGGLYDQSRYFDNVMSRFYARKGWGVVQFSLLRTMSELLIEKTLVERYPELQVQQMSCHAAHIERQRARPCGRCEKCRRIVAMLRAVGADPTACGYTAEQVRGALEAVGRLGLHQERAGASHLLHLLFEQGLVDRDAPQARLASPRPEVMKLRFDPERSPVDAIPVDLRKPLYRILLQHAEGAVRRRGGVWLDADPLEPGRLSVPYRFEPAAQRWKCRRGSEVGSETFELGLLSWPQAAERFREVDVALLPVGAIEQHGPHLPLDVDAFDVAWLSREVAASCTPPRPFVLPLIPYGVSYLHDDFAGTVSVSPEALSRLVYDVGMSVARHGVTKLIVVNGHGGNSPALQYAAQMINRDARIFTCVDTGETSDAEVDAMTETTNDVHAGEVETSTTMALRPDLVNMELARPSVPRFSSEYLDFSSQKGVTWFARTKRISPEGVLGDPTRASADKGRKMWDVMVSNLVRLVEDLKEMSLDELHDRRY